MLWWEWCGDDSPGSRPQRYAGRADDEIVLAAIRLRRRGMKPQQIGPILGISGDKLMSVYQQTQAVRAADIKASGEPAGRVMKDYW